MPWRGPPPGALASVPAGQKGGGIWGQLGLFAGSVMAFFPKKPLVGCAPGASPKCHFGLVGKRFFLGGKNVSQRPRPPKFFPCPKWDILGPCLAKCDLHFGPCCFFAGMPQVRWSMLGSWCGLVGQAGRSQWGSTPQGCTPKGSTPWGSTHATAAVFQAVYYTHAQVLQAVYCTHAQVI